VKNRTPNGRCRVCQHAQRARIELLIAGGASQRSVALRFGLSIFATQRHWSNGHVSDERKAQLVAGPGVKLAELANRAADENISILDSLTLIKSMLFAQFMYASECHDLQGSAQISSKLLEALRMQARLTGQLSQAGASVTNNTLIMQSPEVAEIQAVLIRTLQPFPEARQAVMAALQELDARAHREPAPAALPFPAKFKTDD
jgi:Trp operon repressor